MGVVFRQNVSNSVDRGAFSSGVGLGIFPELLYRLQMFLLEDSLRPALVAVKDDDVFCSVVICPLHFDVKLVSRFEVGRFRVRLQLPEQR